MIETKHECTSNCRREGCPLCPHEKLETEHCPVCDKTNSPNTCRWCGESALIENGNIVSKYNDLTKEIDLFHEHCHADMVRDAIEDDEFTKGEHRENYEEVPEEPKEVIIH